jgi:hypothetical protein
MRCNDSWSRAPSDRAIPPRRGPRPDTGRTRPAPAPPAPDAFRVKAIRAEEHGAARVFMVDQQSSRPAATHITRTPSRAACTRRRSAPPARTRMRNVGWRSPAYPHAASVSLAGTLQPLQPHAVWLVFELVDAASRSGHAADANEHVCVCGESGLDSNSPSLELLIAAAAALTDRDSWRDRFGRAFATPESARGSAGRRGWQMSHGRRQRTTGRGDGLHVPAKFDLLHEELVA